MERAFQKQKEEEMAIKRAEKDRIEKERLEAIKQKEVQRITEERRRNINSTMADDPHNLKYNLASAALSHQQLSHDANNGNSTPTEETNAQKLTGIVNIFGERMKRSPDALNIKRAESMKIGAKLVRRTPSFTTRRRAQSFRKNQQADFDLPPVEIQGMLERKHELQSGGKKAPVRSWKLFYTVLCGQLLCFFKDEDDFRQKKAATAPVNILNARCEKAENYTKKKNVFRLHLPDGSEFLFLASNPDSCADWINKMSFHASLPPNLQLMSYDASIKVRTTFYSISAQRKVFLKYHLISQLQKSLPISESSVASSIDISPISSHASSPDSQRRSSRQASIISTGSSTSTPQTSFLQKQRELRDHESNGYNNNKPPVPPQIPPRGLPPPVPQRNISVTGEAVTLRKRGMEFTEFDLSLTISNNDVIWLQNKYRFFNIVSDPNGNFSKPPNDEPAHDISYQHHHKSGKKF